VVLRDVALDTMDQRYEIFTELRKRGKTTLVQDGEVQFQLVFQEVLDYTIKLVRCRACCVALTRTCKGELVGHAEPVLVPAGNGGGRRLGGRGGVGRVLAALPQDLLLERQARAEPPAQAQGGAQAAVAAD
jgi:hypothetical protein